MFVSLLKHQLLEPETSPVLFLAGSSLPNDVSGLWRNLSKYILPSEWVKRVWPHQISLLSSFDNFITMVSCNFNLLVFKHEQIVQLSILLESFHSFCSVNCFCISFVSHLLSYGPKFKARPVRMFAYFLYYVQPSGCTFATDLI